MYRNQFANINMLGKMLGHFPSFFLLHLSDMEVFHLYPCVSFLQVSMSSQSYVQYKVIYVYCKQDHPVIAPSRKTNVNLSSLFKGDKTEKLKANENQLMTTMTQKRPSALSLLAIGSGAANGLHFMSLAILHFKILKGTRLILVGSITVQYTVTLQFNHVSNISTSFSGFCQFWN